MYENIHVLNVHVSKFCGSPTKIFQHKNFVKLEITVHVLLHD